MPQPKTTRKPLLEQVAALPRADRKMVDFWYTRLSPDKRKEVLELATACNSGDVSATVAQVLAVLADNGVKITRTQWAHFRAGVSEGRFQP